jgi:hypothetical protein
MPNQMRLTLNVKRETKTNRMQDERSASSREGAMPIPLLPFEQTVRAHRSSTVPSENFSLVVFSTT